MAAATTRVGYLCGGAESIEGDELGGGTPWNSLPDYSVRDYSARRSRVVRQPASRQPLNSLFGKRYIYFCPECRKVLGVSHRKGFWMG